MDIVVKTIGHKGAAIARDGSEKLGAMTYSLAGDQLIIIDHTEVEPGGQGKGIGKQMLLAVVEMARKEGKKILPLCPFANAMFKKMPEIGDVLK